MREKILAAGGVLSALAGSTCCILPLVLVTVGVSGAWVGSLAGLAAYQPVFILIAIACLGAGFWLVSKRDAGQCEAGKCTDSQRGRFIKNILWVKAILWIGAVLVGLSLGVDYGLHLLS